MTALQNLLAITDWRSWAVLRRNALVYLRNWRTAFFPPAFEPIVYFLSLGLGLGGYVGSLAYHGKPVDYATYVAPGLLSYTAFGTAFFEALYASYVRMFYQKTWDGMLATQIDLPHVLWGEILWAGLRGTMNAIIVAVVLALFHAFHVIHIAWHLLAPLPLVAFVTGWTFAAFALIFTAIVPSIDHMNYPVFLVGIPLSLISATYFPLKSDHAWLQWIINLNPIYHLSEFYRSILLRETLDQHVWGLLLTNIILLPILTLIAQRLMKRRVLGE